MSQPTTGSAARAWAPATSEIARSVTLKPIQEIGEALGLTADDLEPYGHLKAKVRWRAVARLAANRPDGAPRARHGHDARRRRARASPRRRWAWPTASGSQTGRRSIVALREPSLGPCFGMKGGAAGGGHAQVVPMEDINLHFTGDLHAIGAAHNLLAAMLDNHISPGQPARHRRRAASSGSAWWT